MQNISSLPPSQRVLIDSELPLKWYFLYVGGALLTILFAADAVMPRPVNEIIVSGPALPRVRIYSEHKGPEAVVIDTKQPAIMPAFTEQTELPLRPQTVALPNARMRRSFAQLVAPSHVQVGERGSKKEERKLQSKRKVTRAHLRHQAVVVAQRQYFGLFNTRW